MAFWNRKKSSFGAPEFDEGDAKGFWHWFSNNEFELALGFKSYLAGQKPDDTCGDALSAALNRYHPELVFEMGNLKNGKLDFVVSADGLFANFPAVVRLVNCATVSAHFQFTAFRQRTTDVSLSIFGEKFQPETTRFAIKPSEYDHAKFDLAIFMGEHPLEMQQLRQAAYILLDSVIGEYDMETLIGRFEVFENPPGIQTNELPLTDLPRVLDDLMAARRRD